MKDPLTSPGKSDAVPTGVVMVAAESRSQVELVASPTGVVMRIRSVRDTSVELVGSHFFPKACRLEVAVQGALGEPPIRFTGTVRKAQTVGVEPTYWVTLQVERESAKALHRVGIGVATAHDDVPSWLDRTLAGVGPIPSWASGLVAMGLLEEGVLRTHSSAADSERVPLEDYLIRQGVVRKETIAACMALQMSVPYVEPQAYRLCPANRELIPGHLAKRHGIYPLFHLGGVMTLGMDDPTDLALIDQIRLRTSSQVDPCLCPPGMLAPLIDGAYRGEPGVEAPPSSIQAGVPEEVGHDDMESSSEIARLVQSMIEAAARRGASDIHVEPERDHVRIRVRVDGILHETNKHPFAQHSAIISRMKVQAGLDIAETRRAQDGHFSQVVGGTNVDVRLSTIPTTYGENAVLRLLLSNADLVGLGDLGMPDGVLTRVQALLDQPNGMMLVTGPTGSGKTSTLYAALERLNTMDRNVVTVEDPVEKRVHLLRQTEVNAKAGMTFANALRSILRQDPDVIMVGEIRDQETGEIAVQAALTGHLVLSTLHTNTAAGAIVRLSEMGVAPFLLTSSLRAVLGQRLVRRVCTRCAETTSLAPGLARSFGLDSEKVQVQRGTGCPHCLNTGYKGRVGLFELVEITESLADAILGGASRAEIEGEASRSSGDGMRLDGLRKVMSGETTLEEVARVVGVGSSRTQAQGK